MAVDFEAVSAAVRATGLIPRGGFHPQPEDQVPPLPGGEPPATVVLVGSVGGDAGRALWAAFRSSPEADSAAHPLDRWCERVTSGLAVRLEAHALFPFHGPPYLPFLRWALRAETVWPSPLGMLIHPDYGLWHAYRGALAFAQRLELPSRPSRDNPCDSCRERPCLSACPVDAFTGQGYDVAPCVDWIANERGAACLHGSCRARVACPVGPEYRYHQEQAQFHMQAFLAARRRAAHGGQR
ncbi:MAG: hypothetical protein GWN84_09045 [Gammaproteobacteria bacterium]|nr:hypothetical protein [Gammaproteobacteria bacterium]NIR83015.1 hypothetical protein [Gammaproteobacteria bacterium]NIR90682.1 hypothetical protein [Gammaproteobacteria bacterium]NIU04170.1 hypothetical protein [Gammaproteobacteria bacterium]NIV51461.1 hypothetical protein [Gammaproteobacteria bacterium]